MTRLSAVEAVGARRAVVAPGLAVAGQAVVVVAVDALLPAVEVVGHRRPGVEPQARRLGRVQHRRVDAGHPEAAAHVVTRDTERSDAPNTHIKTRGEGARPPHTSRHTRHGEKRHARKSGETTKGLVGMTTA